MKVSYQKTILLTAQLLLFLFTTGNATTPTSSPSRGSGESVDQIQLAAAAYRTTAEQPAETKVSELLYHSAELTKAAAPEVINAAIALITAVLEKAAAEFPKDPFTIWCAEQQGRLLCLKNLQARGL